jgi:hypothetical protein
VSVPLFLGLAKLDQQHTKHTSEAKVVKKPPCNGEDGSAIRLSIISGIDKKVPPVNGYWEDERNLLRHRPAF